MTRETKVGLFVGLGFIILFAVAISNLGGAEARNAPPNFTMAAVEDGRNSGGPSGRSQNGASEGRLPVHRALEATQDPIPPLEPQGTSGGSRLADAGNTPVDLPTLPDVTPVPEGPGPSGPPAPVDQLTMAGEGRGSPIIPRRTDRLDEQSFEPLRSGQQAIVGPRQDQTSGDAGNLKTQLPAGLPADIDQPQRETTPADAGPSRDEPPTDTVQRDSAVASANIATHRTQRGDSLAKLARQYYKTESPEAIDCIFLANRNLLRDRNSVPLGKDIMIPMLVGFQTPAGGDDVTQPTRPQGPPRIPVAQADDRKPAKANASLADTRTCKVRPRDTLRAIAARELGDPNLADEIFKLNRDKLKSPHVVISGIQLRLPPREPSKAAAKPAAGARREASSNKSKDRKPTAAKTSRRK